MLHKTAAGKCTFWGWKRFMATRPVQAVDFEFFYFPFRVCFYLDLTVLTKSPLLHCDSASSRPLRKSFV